MVNNTLCPLCNAPMIIQKGARISTTSQHYQTKKSHVYCSKCNRSAKEALAIKLHSPFDKNYQNNLE
jgi:RNase P subunit RPR2